MKFKFLLAIAVGMALVASCTNEDEYFTEDALDERLQNLKERVMRIAVDYGFDDYQVDENLLRMNLDMTDDEIEQGMRMLAYLPGTYILESDGNGKYVIKGKLSRKRLTRGVDDFSWPENESGSFDGRDSKDEDFVVEGSFDYGYGQSGNDHFDASFNVSCWETDENGENGHWGEPQTGTIISGDNTLASGHIDNAGMGGVYVIEVKTGNSYRYFEVSVSGNHGNEHGSMTVTPLPYSDSRVSNWRNKNGR